jgi:hypothetical protein
MVLQTLDDPQGGISENQAAIEGIARRIEEVYMAALKACGLEIVKLRRELRLAKNRASAGQSRVRRQSQQSALAAQNAELRRQLEAVRADGAVRNHRDWPRAPIPRPAPAVFA